MRLLIFLPLIASASVQFQPIPLLEAKGDDMQVTLPARKAIEEMTEGFQVTAVIEVDTRTSLATLLWRHLSATHAKPFDMFSAPLWFIFTPPLPGNTKPHALLVAPLWDCAHASNSTRVAINIMASLSQHILINIPQDSVSQLCVPALQALIAESDLTHRNAHKPTGNENERFTTDAQVNEDWFTFLPRLQVIVSGGWITRDIDSLLRMDGAAPFKSVEAIAVPFFESADFSFQTSDIGRWPEVVEKLDIVANNVGADAADWPKFLWLHSGQRFLVWLDHVKDAVAPRLNLSSSFASFATKLRTLALDRAVGRYVYEMNGAIKYGWIINKDGSTTRAIAPPSAESDVEQSEEQSALVNTDVNLGKYKLRPPPASDLRRLHDGASARGEQFIRVLLNGITDEDAAVVELNGQLEQRYKVLEGTNTDNIKRFVKECEEELKQVCEQRITRLSSTLPVPKKQIDETVQRVLDDCTKDLTVVAGYLEGEVFERAKAAMVLGLTKAGEKQNRVNGQMVRKQLEECIQKALDEGSLKHLQSLLPLGRQEMAELVETAEKKATETWDAETVQVFKGSAVWPERFDDVKNYMVELDRLLQKQKKDLEGENRVAVQEKCKVKVDELIHDFRKSVVKGQTLPYPGPESIIFDRAALEATSYVATYATSLSEFSDIPSFSDEKRRLEEALQAKICGAADSVMAHNAQVYRNQPWVRSAMVDAERKMEVNPESKEQAGLLFQEFLAQHGGQQFTEMAEPLKQRLVQEWCTLKLGDCPGNCVNWSSGHPVIHFMDVMGLCEANWPFCNYNGFGGQGKGSPWKEGSPFTQCPAVRIPPCATFWDRRGRLYYVKYIMRAGCFVSFGVAVAALVLRQLRLYRERQFQPVVRTSYASHSKSTTPSRKRR